MGRPGQVRSVPLTAVPLALGLGVSAGMLPGARFAPRLPDSTVQRGFALLLVALAVRLFAGS
jgi:uncharacterized membrane protein YfcA